VQIAAVSEDQTDNTYLTLYELLTANEAKAAESLGIDVGRTRLHLRARPATALEPVTASAGSREGQRLTFVVLDETHLWTTQNKGVKLAATLRRNAAKMSGRTFETTNAPVLGEGSVAEVSGKDVDAGAPGILYYNRRPAVEPDPGWSDEQLEEALRHCYGGARWVTDNLARIVAEVRDPATEWTDALRFFFNIRTTGAGKAVDPRRWDELLAPGEVGEGTEIGVGFKSSQVATVIRGCTREGYAWTLAEWHRPEGVMGWRVDRADVSAAVARIFERYHVGRMLCDPPGWRSEIEEWEATWPDRVLAFETSSNRRFALAVDRWTTAIREGSHHHDGDPITREHVRQATLRKVHVTQADEDSRTLYVLQEVGNVAAAISDVLALEAASTMEALPVVAVRWV
jgi:hypothetical protein